MPDAPGVRFGRRTETGGRGHDFKSLAGACLFAGSGVLPGLGGRPPTPPAAAAPPAPLSTGPATISIGCGAPAAPPPTRPEFLGITGAFKAGGACLTRFRALLGMRFPCLEAKPALPPISDPANLDSPGPAVAAAAEVKAQEDAAPQKIKGLRYLATIGCGGCHPDVEKALLAGLDDCTEAVRYEAAAGLRQRAGNPCERCNEKPCCSEAVKKKMADIAFGKEPGTDCYKEPSARVRRMARLVLAGCGCPSNEPLPQEGPPGPAQPATAQPTPAPAAAVSWRPTPQPASAPQTACPDCAPAYR